MKDVCYTRIIKFKDAVPHTRKTFSLVSDAGGGARSAGFACPKRTRTSSVHLTVASNARHRGCGALPSMLSGQSEPGRQVSPHVLLNRTQHLHVEAELTIKYFWPLR